MSGESIAAADPRSAHAAKVYRGRGLWRSEPRERNGVFHAERSVKRSIRGLEVNVIPVLRASRSRSSPV